MLAEGAAEQIIPWLNQVEALRDLSTCRSVLQAVQYMPAAVVFLMKMQVGLA